MLQGSALHVLFSVEFSMVVWASSTFNWQCQVSVSGSVPGRSPNTPHLQVKHGSRKAEGPVGHVHPSHIGWLAASLPAQKSREKFHEPTNSCRLHHLLPQLGPRVFPTWDTTSSSANRSRTSAEAGQAGGEAAVHVLRRHGVVALLAQLTRDGAKNRLAVGLLAQVAHMRRRACIACNTSVSQCVV